MDQYEEDYLEEEDEVLIVEPPPDMLAYLKELYPSASEAELDLYLDQIRTFDSEKLPPTDTAKAFIEQNKLVKEQQDRLKELRTELLTEYLKLGHQIGSVSITPSKGKRSFNPDEFYKWVSGLPAVQAEPALLEEMTKPTIDLKVFYRLEAQGKLTYDEIPDNVATRGKPSYTVNIDGNRSKKKKDVQ